MSRGRGSACAIWSCFACCRYVIAVHITTEPREGGRQSEELGWVLWPRRGDAQHPRCECYKRRDSTTIYGLTMLAFLRDCLISAMLKRARRSGRALLLLVGRIGHSVC